MARRVTVQVVGGQSKTFDDVSTVGEIKDLLNLQRHTATVNGETASNEATLSDYSFVHLAPAVKGGN